MPHPFDHAPAGLPGAEAPTLSTKALCAAAGVARGVLRLYEREGLIPLPRRKASGYRCYDSSDIVRLQVIRNLKEIGLTLKEIALFLDERDHGELDPVRLRELACEQLAVIDTRIARLNVVRGYMAAVADGNTALIDDPQCSFLIEFVAAGQGRAAPADTAAGAAAAAAPHGKHRGTPRRTPQASPK
jgi:MerR family copper efflux transcriptional regulator